MPYAVEEQYVGTAYGVMTAVQNTGLATFPLAVSALLTSCTNNPPKKLDQVLSQSDFTGCSNVSPPHPFPPRLGYTRHQEVVVAVVVGFLEDR